MQRKFFIIKTFSSTNSNSEGLLNDHAAWGVALISSLIKTSCSILPLVVFTLILHLLLSSPYLTFVNSPSIKFSSR
jgi:hypothetical protein